MPVGNQSSRADFDTRLGQLSLQTNQILTNWLSLKSHIDSMMDHELLDLGYTPGLAPPTAPPTTAHGTGSSTLTPSTIHYVSYAWGTKTGPTTASPTATFTTDATPVPEDITCPAAPTGTMALYVYLGTSPSTLFLAATVLNPATAGSNVVTVSAPAPAGALAPSPVNVSGDLLVIRGAMADTGLMVGIFTGQVTLNSVKDFRNYIRELWGLGY
jgi:hypothetical protein